MKIMDETNVFKGFFTHLVVEILPEEEDKKKKKKF